MKALYIVDYWVPFPASEHGGVVSLIADSDAEAFIILSEEQQYDERYVNMIMPSVVNAQKFTLQDEYVSGIVDSFTT
jgi:hypothetical protein